MHTIKKLIIFLITGFLLNSAFSEDTFSQGKGPGKGKGKAVKEKKHAPPPWAPAHGYKKRHVFFPDYLCYYDCHKGLYIYFSEKNNNWTTVTGVPLFMKKVDVKAAVKIEIDLDDDVDFPQQFFEEHRKLYPKGAKQ